MDISNLTVREFAELFQKIGQERNLFVFAAGTYGNIIGKFFLYNNISWNGYIDNNIKLQHEIINKKKIEIFDKKNIVNSVFLISTVLYNDIYEQLILNGVNSSDIYWFSNAQLLERLLDAVQDDVKIYTQKITEFRRIHQNERCFIVGNGPSLRLSDLEKIKNEYSMAVNKIYQLYNRTEWRPTYYFAEDPYVMKNDFAEKQDFVCVANESKAAFTSTRRKIFEFKDDVDMNKVFFFRAKANTNVKQRKIEFSEECSDYIYTDCSATYSLLQLAVYMGFNKIYLIGIDHNYSLERNIKGEVVKYSNVRNHVQGMEDNNFEEERIPEVERFELGYQAAKIYAESHNIKIYNATRGGKLEVFERIDFDSLFI